MIRCAGGADMKTSTRIYYSWDIRLYSLGLAVIFLMAYYYR